MEQTPRHISDFNHEVLNAAATAKDKRLQRWVGIKSGSNKRRYLCRLCGNIQIDSESARWPMTKHSHEAIKRHMSFHLQQLEEEK